MSVIQVEKTLHDFAVKKMGSAIVLKGEWGTGKTYLWNSIIKKHRSNFGRANYSYVSLFGVNSLADLKRSIFENTVPSAKANEVTSKNSVIENLKKLDFSDAFGGLRRAFSFGKEAKIPFVGSFGGLIDSIQYSLVADTIICIDDFERRGNSLSARDVLGLVSNLIESKDCSVILVLNDGSLDKNDEFFTYSEKVFDYEVLYSPTAKDSVSLIFDANNPLFKMIGDNCEFLKINNIRLLKKIELFANLLSEKLKGSQALVIEQACKVLPLAVLAIYGERNSKVNLDFILTHGTSNRLRLPDPNATKEDLEATRIDAEKTSYLQEYGFIRCGEFELAVINLVKKGYADEDLIKKIVEEIEREIRHNNDIAILREAWKIYNSSFLDNEAEILLAFDRAIKAGLDKFSLEDLDSVAFLYFGLGKEKEIQPIIDKYFTDIYPAYGVKDEDDIFQWPSNSYVRQSLEKYFEGLVFKGSFSELMQAALANPSNPYEIIKGLAEKDEVEFYDYFSKLNDHAFTYHARLLLKLGSTSFPNQADSLIYRDIFIKTFKSLKDLSEATALNKLRMVKFVSYEQLYLRDMKKIEKEAEEAAEAEAASKPE
ncbi:P-loop NTPase fold protein [Pseudomonas asplenii]|uniref:KAP family P-loop domain-containing protein n=1 Tax=Pseudomonas asplenii TaxID=53407 RepID=A0A1H6N9Z4_9PSED|nr:P-loop NTPase fold protein [Pseudomonas fuscovaginae]SEI11705.1 KAP family P-loop domain-containing protein [Pseudomonas fuscovaginae]